MRDTPDMQRAVLALAQEMGINPGRITPSQYTSLAIKVRSSAQLVRDATRAVLSRAHGVVHLRVVSEEKAAANEQVCRTANCGKFRVMVDPRTKEEVPACDACTCSGKYLKAKWRDKKQRCPLDHWTNQNAEGTWVSKPGDSVEVKVAQNGDKAQMIFGSPE